MKGTAVSYRVFVRNWYRWGAAHGVRTRVPDPGSRKTVIARRCTEQEALCLCEAYANTHKPGPLSRKAEYERED